ncbi:hypothetical protein [Chromobacterium vaccinii]|uniref:hypothetical protein n=1 Tax=Chromobacterium vaccinii TaxID=1108595 RepID=UPI003459968B
MSIRQLSRSYLIHAAAFAPAIAFLLWGRFGPGDAGARWSAAYLAGGLLALQQTRAAALVFFWPIHPQRPSQNPSKATASFQNPPNAPGGGNIGMFSSAGCLELNYHE